ncbi:hypothetical protein EDC01DRAFT_447543 [Geopyxis carbonaria]|nr:hypothetical protein EDC01DRAFT_447543 [Geopyxis carbonaria]
MEDHHAQRGLALELTNRSPELGRLGKKGHRYDVDAREWRASAVCLLFLGGMLWLFRPFNARVYSELAPFCWYPPRNINQPLHYPLSLPPAKLVSETQLCRPLLANRVDVFQLLLLPPALLSQQFPSLPHFPTAFLRAQFFYFFSSFLHFCTPHHNHLLRAIQLSYSLPPLIPYPLPLARNLGESLKLASWTLTPASRSP